MKFLHSIYPYLLFTLLLLSWGTSQASPSADEISADRLSAKLEETRTAENLDEATRSRLLDWYHKALGYLKAADANQAAADTFRTARESAPKETRAIRDMLEQDRKTSPLAGLNISHSTPIGEIEQILLKQKIDRDTIEARLEGRINRLTVEAGRPDTIHQQISKIELRRAALADELKLAPSDTEQPATATARQYLLLSEDAALSSEIERLNQELLSQSMRMELLKAQRDQSLFALEGMDARIKLLEETLADRRLAEAEQARIKAEQAKRSAIGKHPLVQRLAEQNSALSEMLGALAVKLEIAQTSQAHASKEFKRIENSFRSIQQRLEVAGLSQSLGEVMLRQRRTLPDIHTIRRMAREREQEIAEAGLQQIQHEEEERTLQNTNDYIDSLQTTTSRDGIDAIRSELVLLIENRKELLKKAIATDTAFIRALGELDFTQRQLLKTVEAFDAFLAERLLWVRSSPLPTVGMLLAIPEQAAELLSPDHWLEVLRVLGNQSVRSPILALSVILFAGLVWRSGKLRTALTGTGEKILRPGSDRYIFTLQAVLLTLLLAAPWPLLLAISGWQLATATETDSFTGAVGHGLVWVANSWFYLATLGRLCLPGGLAEAHFRWPESSLKALRHNIHTLMLTLLPAAFIALIVFTYDSPIRGGGLGRLAFVIVLMALALFFYRLFWPGKGVLQHHYDTHPKSTLTRLRYLWLALGVIVPLILSVLAVMGYLYNAGTLTQHLIDTIWFILILVIIQQLMVRWLLVIRRRLAFQTAIERRRAEQARELAAPDGKEPAEMLEEPDINLDTMSQDSLKLLNTVLEIIGLIGIWLIWAKLLPAFGLLDDITLWNQQTIIAGEEKLIPVTVADAMLALLVGIATIVATRRFPALLEIGLLQHMKMTSGGRYAATTLSRYAIAAIGTILVITIIGGSWSQLQWLVAALGVGIGFGLQEIVANFISGLIILFERPIRVGDVVTVGDTDGVVTRIQIRATTIRQWDLKELLVPNKEFITGRLLNWSLSDQTTRILIPVGIAYGSDVQLAMALLAEAAEENEKVLRDPPPFVIFEGFGDNALTLNLRCYLATVENRLITISELHQAINEKFNSAGVEIAFPQRDIHLDTTRPLDIRINKED